MDAHGVEWNPGSPSASPTLQAVQSKAPSPNTSPILQSVGSAAQGLPSPSPLTLPPAVGGSPPPTSSPK